MLRFDSVVIFSFFFQNTVRKFIVRSCPVSYQHQRKFTLSLSGKSQEAKSDKIISGLESLSCYVKIDMKIHILVINLTVKYQSNLEQT